MYVYAWFPFIMSYCRRVLIPLSFTTVGASHCSYSLLVGPRGDVRVVSLMVNGYADIYKDNRRKIYMLSTEPALSTVAVKPKITSFKTGAITVNVTIGIVFCVD